MLGSTQVESPRLRTLLGNGTTLMVERMPRAKELSVQLFAGVRGAMETPATHGWRHLLEHLVLKGKAGDLDRRLERSGLFMTGRTFRDAMQVEISGRPADLDLALSTLDEILSERAFPLEQIQKEAAIMEHELAQEGDASILTRAAWSVAYGERGLDPYGRSANLRAADFEALQSLFARQFSPANLVVVVVGDVNVASVTDRLRKQFQDREGPEVKFDLPRKGAPGRIDHDEAFGEVRGSIVDGLQKAGPALAAAYGIAARLDNAFVTYTPCAGEGLALIGRIDRNNTLGTFIDELSEGNEAALMPIGKALAQRWLAGMLATPRGSGFVRGLLMAQKPGVNAEDLLKAIQQTTWPQFQEAIAGFRKERAAIAVGIWR